MKENWGLGTFWYSLALASPPGLFTVFDKQLQPRFIEHCPEYDAFVQVMPWNLGQDWAMMVVDKLWDREKYDIQLQQAFSNEPYDLT